ncbi:MAG: IS3 family transposase [Bacillota bacterium]
MLKVSTSAYYDWLGSKDERDRRVQKYVTAIKELFEKSENTYGVDRICGCLRKRGYTASYKRVSRIMYELGLVSIHRRRRQRSLTDSRDSRGRELPNLIQGLNITEPFQVITSDISYVRTAEGFEYLCAVKDVVSGIVLAQTMSDNMKADLVASAYAAPNCPKATGIACPQTAGYNVWENCLGRRKTPGIGSRGPKTHHGHCIMLHEHMG